MSLILACSLGVAACTPMQWLREGAAPDAAALEKDSIECRQQAWQEAQYRAFAYPAFGPVLSRDVSGRRFAGWPYRPYAYPFGDPFLEESRLTQFCMRNKGYELVPVEKKDAPKASG
ncbi:MAG TPA: hypothetical protein VGI18_09380 [Burkholderiales bacterium]